MKVEQDTSPSRLKTIQMELSTPILTQLNCVAGHTQKKEQLEMEIKSLD
jgi:hypothetical protein